MGILLVYDVTDEQSFLNIRNWIRNIEQHASDSVQKILIGNKCDMTEDKPNNLFVGSKQVIDTNRGQELADEYGIKFFETSAKTDANVKKAFIAIATDIVEKKATSGEKNTNNGSGLDLDKNKGNTKKGCNCGN
ncbi:Rab GTPase [Reticulomyxa filosa]|uniref:Rab GTPase n=1 Tax=Reticulomyxa filosa TaxID=46433 RepID=X6N5D5_RETFI|nr:Rab GTPase [Reticulomyxa filosa]|eukprot:ETO21485.1 Rab GTPase [Reticulomyxa filosa]